MVSSSASAVRRLRKVSSLLAMDSSFVTGQALEMFAVDADGTEVTDKSAGA